ncbi:hypothetical protein [Paenibacillus polysaccharolyticus]|uniref:hypothetical protein n=1 Tax=Paenibacillus polysaccharolyticus TaxID=582692 RepID=UPI00280AD577|nr:hypothetical protein [Paenibacillus polysaccharolyticus]
MAKYDAVLKNEIIQLLDKNTELEDEIFDNFSGEDFANSTEPLRVSKIRDVFELLIPKTTWTKEDYVKQNRDLSIEGVKKDKNGEPQLIISIDGVRHTFITTSEAVNHLFVNYKMNHYAKFMLSDQDEHFDQILSNFEYWFKEQYPEEDILVRTVIEDGNYIIRCFATPKYRPIDNHVLLYMSLWALDQLPTTFYLALQRIDHSRMTLHFVSDEAIEIKGIGTLSYGFTLVNGEDKSKVVGFHPTFDLVNLDGTATTLVLDKPVRIVHRGKSLEPIMRSLDELKDIRSHVEWVTGVIRVAHNAKIDDVFAYKIQQEIIKIIGQAQFSKFSQKFNEISSNNAYNLLQFFGRLNEMDVPDEDEAIKIKVLFWRFMEEHTKKKK